VPTKPAEWPYRADPPQRYRVNYDRYLRRGGRVDLGDDIRAFVSGGNVGDISRFYFFSLAFDQLQKENVVGDVAELGVYRGNTASLLAKMARRLGTTAFLLDTFEGFSKTDLRGIDAGQKMQFTDTSLEAVRDLVGADSVRFIKGHFPGTASELPDTSYCLVHIDCDLYAPIYSALEYFYPRMLPGGYLIVHDYSSLAWDGAERAVDEFFSDKPECLIPLTDGAGSVVIRKAREPAANPGWLAQKRMELFSDAWVRADHGKLTDILGVGWSRAESWGVWGIGDVQTIKLVLREPATEDVVLEAEVKAPLMGDIKAHSVDVFVSDQKLATWEFTATANRCIQSVRIPKALVPERRFPVVELSFKPCRTIRPVDVNPASSDVRHLAMALMRLRRGDS
jgi:hypothetical protein